MRLRLSFTVILLPVLLWLGGCAAPKKPEPVELVYPLPPDPPRFYFERTLRGAGDVRPVTEEDRLRVALTGERQFVGMPFQKPFDVAVHQGRVFVSDTVARAVHVMDFPTQKAFQIGTRGDQGDLVKPLGIAADSGGRVFVVDGSAKSVKVYDRDGNYQRDIGSGELLSRPSGADVSPDDRLLFVVDTGGIDREDAHRVLVFDTATGQLVRTIGSRGAGQAQFNLARDVAVTPQGIVYVTDSGNFRVQAFTQEGAFIRAWGKPGRYPGQFSRAKGVASDAEGNVYVADAAFGNFQIFNPEGQLLLYIGQRSTESRPGTYMLPSGIDVDEDGRVYFVEQFFRKVDIFRPAHVAPEEGYLGRPQPSE